MPFIVETTGGWGPKNHLVLKAFTHAAALLHTPPTRWWQPLLSFSHRRELIRSARNLARKSLPHMASHQELNLDHFVAKEF